MEPITALYLLGGHRVALLDTANLKTPNPKKEGETKMKLPQNLTLDEVMEAAEADESLGFCMACGESQGGVEPDAEKYECKGCGRQQVYGAEQILILTV